MSKKFNIHQLGDPMAWTAEQAEILKQNWKSGLSAAEIAKKIGGVTKNAVIGKAKRMDLGPHPREPGGATSTEMAVWGYSGKRRRSPRKPRIASPHGRRWNQQADYRKPRTVRATAKSRAISNKEPRVPRETPLFLSTSQRRERGLSDSHMFFEVASAFPRASADLPGDTIRALERALYHD